MVFTYGKSRHAQYFRMWLLFFALLCRVPDEGKYTYDMNIQLNGVK